MGAWEIVLDGYEIGSGLPAQVGPTPVTFARGQLRTDDDERPLRHGMIALRPDLLSTLQMTVPFTILREGDMVAASDERDVLIGAWKPKVTPEYCGVTEPTGKQYALYGKARDVFGVDESKIRNGLITGSALFEATDPVLYSFADHFETGGLFAGAGGFGFPFGFPFGFAPGGSPDLTIDNAGTAETWPIVWWECTAGLGNLTITDHTGGRVWMWDGTIPDGLTLVVNMRDGTVLQTATPAGDLSDAVSRSDRLRRPLSDWLNLPAGTSQWTVQAGLGTGTARVFWRDAWYR